MVTTMMMTMIKYSTLVNLNICMDKAGKLFHQVMVVYVKSLSAVNVRPAVLYDSNRCNHHHHHHHQTKYLKWPK